MKHLLPIAFVGAALALTGCLDTDAPDDATLATSTQPVLGASCTFGDGFVLASGGNKTIYPVSCASDCLDFPNGGLDYTLFCKDGVLGEWDPTLTGGTVGPAINGAIFNGNSRCTAKPTATWAQSADRKRCVPR